MNGVFVKQPTSGQIANVKLCNGTPYAGLLSAFETGNPLTLASMADLLERREVLKSMFLQCHGSDVKI